MALYSNFVRNALVRGIALGAPIKAALMGVMTQDVGAQTLWSDIQHFERTSMLGYTPGGVTVSAFEPIYDPATLTVGLTCDPISFGMIDAGDQGIHAVAFYADTGIAGASPLISVDLFSIPAYPAGQDFTYTPASTGLISIQIQAEVVIPDPGLPVGQD